MSKVSRSLAGLNATDPAASPAAFLRKREAAKYLSVSPRTLTAWMRRGILPYAKPARKIILFSVRDLERTVARFRVEEAR
jgi:excisionase family DNA binding protein